MDATIVAIVISGIVAAVAVGTLWMRIGGMEKDAGAARDSARDAHARIDQLVKEIGIYQLQAAKDYATYSALLAAESRFANAVDGLGGRFDAMATRLDRVLEGAFPSHHRGA